MFLMTTLAFSSKNGKYITLVNRGYTSNNRIQINSCVYTSFGGHILNATDTYLNSNAFTRTIGNVTKTIDLTTKNVTDSSIIKRIFNIKSNPKTTTPFFSFCNR